VQTSSFLSSRWAPIAGVAAATAAALAAADDSGPVLCLFRRCTGGYCPGCGLTRSAGRLVRGDLAGSWHQHPFLAIAMAQLVVLAAVLAARYEAGLQAIRRRALPLLAVNGAVLLGVWILRLSTGAIPAPFAS
jgi:hypothetical protein